MFRAILLIAVTGLLVGWMLFPVFRIPAINRGESRGVWTNDHFETRPLRLFLRKSIVVADGNLHSESLISIGRKVFYWGERKFSRNGEGWSNSVVVADVTHFVLDNMSIYAEARIFDSSSNRTRWSMTNISTVNPNPWIVQDLIVVCKNLKNRPLGSGQSLTSQAVLPNHGISLLASYKRIPTDGTESEQINKKPVPYHSVIFITLGFPFLWWGLGWWKGLYDNPYGRSGYILATLCLIIGGTLWLYGIEGLTLWSSRL